MGLARVSLAACALAVWLGALVPSADSAPGVRFGIQDDAWLEYGPGRIGERVRQLDELGLDIVRVTLHWHEMERARGRYDWRRSDRLLNALRAGGLDIVATVWGTPAWAGNGLPNSAPLRPADLQRFARIVAARYPFVRHWTLWNEPNKPLWLNPASPGDYVQRILNPGYRGIKAANPAARVAGGVTAPRGGQNGTPPVDFIRGMAVAGARLDAYAHHPYPEYPGDTPYSGGCRNCKTISMSTIERLLREVGRAFPRAAIWLTEYGYQSDPDPVGVSQDVQAQYVAQAARRVYSLPRVEMLIHYLYRDEPDLARWQSGLETVDGEAKVALAATMLPLTQLSRSGPSTTVWGQIRPGTGARRYSIQILQGGAWASLGGLHVTSPRGYFQRTVRAPRGSRLRVSYPARSLTSPTLVVR